MQRNYKLIISIIALSVSSLCAFAQETVEYKDVILDGKPAKLNTATGEIMLVNSLETKKVESVPLKESIPETGVTESTTDFHIVKEGETLFKIANAYNTSLTALKKANNLETTLVNKGQWIRVRNLENGAASTVSASSNSIVDPDIHSVEKGQTLFSIARGYGITVNELKKQNGLNSDTIKIGLKLRVANFNTTRSQNSVWIVKKGDTLYGIALKNGTTVNTIKSLNGLSNDVISIGQKLKLK